MAIPGFTGADSHCLPMQMSLSRWFEPLPFTTNSPVCCFPLTRIRLNKTGYSRLLFHPHAMDLWARRCPNQPSLLQSYHRLHLDQLAHPGALKSLPAFTLRRHSTTWESLVWSLPVVWSFYWGVCLNCSFLPSFWRRILSAWSSQPSWMALSSRGFIFPWFAHSWSIWIYLN